MSRRRGQKPAQPFDAAWSQINRLEAAVIHQMVPIEFDTITMAKFLWPADVVSKLLAAYPYQCTTYEQSAVESTYFDLPSGQGGRVMGTINLNSKSINMITPKEGLIVMQPEHDKGILHALSETYAIHKKFEDVRRVVRWLNEHATPAAARNYFPPILSLLPAAHPVQDVQGERYREPTADMTEIAPFMRECAVTIVSALLSKLDHPNRTGFRVAFHGTRNCKDEYGRDGYSSEFFGLC